MHARLTGIKGAKQLPFQVISHQSSVISYSGATARVVSVSHSGREGGELIAEN
jgi:hypothetical protein